MSEKSKKGVKINYTNTNTNTNLYIKYVSVVSVKVAPLK